MKILFCTDGSQISINAIKNCRHWVASEDARVDIISVIDWNFLPDEINLEAPGFYEFCTDSADETLENAREHVQNAGFTVDKLLKHCGSTAESILEELEGVSGGKYDLVVLGSHGKKGLSSWLGSISRAIAANSRTCTYIAKHENSGKKILFTTDGTKISTEGIAEAISHLNLKDKEIYICMAVEEPDLLFLEGTLDANWFTEIEKQQGKYAERAVDKIRQMIEKSGCEVKEAAVLTGNPARKILEYSKNKAIDLILMSSKHSDKKLAFLNGAVCKRVLENTPADVIIAKKHLK